MAVSGACWGTHALSVARQFWRGGCSSATGCWTTNCKTPGVAGARPRGAWLQGGVGHPSPPALSAWWKLPDVRQFFVVAPLLWSPGPCRAVPCRAVLRAASPGPAPWACPAQLASWVGGVVGSGGGGRWCDPPGADWSHLSQSSASCSPKQCPADKVKFHTPCLWAAGKGCRIQGMCRGLLTSVQSASEIDSCTRCRRSAVTSAHGSMHSSKRRPPHCKWSGELPCMLVRLWAFFVLDASVVPVLPHTGRACT